MSEPEDDRALEERLKHLSPAKRALVELQMRKARGAPPPKGIVKQPRSKGRTLFPASSTQRRLWFLGQYEPESSAYNVSLPLRMRGPLNVRALEESLHDLGLRHESLRTSFTSIDGEPWQVVHDLAPIRLEIRDQTAAGEAVVFEAVEREQQRVFDLSTPPLVRAVLFKVSDNDHVALFTLHHIIADGASLAVIVRELTTFYEARCRGRPAELPELKVQFGDYAAWERRQLEDGAYQDQLAFWTKALAGAPEVLELPVDGPRTSGTTGEGRRFTFTLSSSLSRAALRFAESHNASLFMVLLSVFKVVLLKYTGQPDLVVGTPIANRTRPELEEIVGFFANTLVLRTMVSPELTFNELVAAVKRMAVDAYAHSDAPFERIVELIQPDRKAGVSPIFQVEFIVTKAPRDELKLEDLTFAVVPEKSVPLPFDLIVEFAETGAALYGAITYNCALFSETRMRRLQAHLAKLLESVLAEPNRKLGTIDLLTQSEAHELLLEWSAAEDPKVLPKPETIGNQEYVAPRNATEECLASIWEKVLRVERVGIEDNFFELGGHSLLATKLVSRIRQELKTDLMVRDVFDAPTIKELITRLREPNKPSDAVLVALDRKKPLPLSYAQERLWFLDQLQPGGYVIYIAVRVQGRLDRQALERTLEELVRRHEALRTTVEQEDARQSGHRAERGIQRIAPAKALTLLIDLVTEPELESKVHAEVSRAFDLAKGPLFRAKLFGLGPEEHVLVLAMHHIVSDGWSMGILLREVAALYEAYSHGRSSPLPELGIQYADYAVWQRAWLSSGELARQLAYWEDKLRGLPTLDLPTDRARPPISTRSGRDYRFRLPFLDPARALNRHEGSSLFMLLLASWQFLLSRYSGQNDFGIGTPIANRTLRETEGLIGLFVNTLVMRADLRQAGTFRDLLRRVKETSLAGYAHQEAPFEKVVDALHPERDMSRSPLFQVMFVLQNTADVHDAPIALKEVVLAPVPTPTTEAKFELTLQVVEASDASLDALIEYNTDLFDRSTVARLAKHFEVLVHEAWCSPDASLETLELLTAEERHRLLVEWNDTQANFAENKTLHQLVEEQVVRTPNAIAVVCGNESLTYRELDVRAEALATKLRREGFGAERLVGVCLERTPALLVALLGTLKSGAGYLPLDRRYPRERLELTLRAAGVDLVLTDAEAERVLPMDNVKRWNIDTHADVSSTADSSHERIRATVHPDNIAYAIFTSGSTGIPKGVVIQHSSVAPLLAWAHRTFGIELLANVLASTSVCFDLSVYELFAPLTCGGRVTLVPDALAIAASPPTGDLTLVNTVPSAMNELLRLGALPRSVRTVNLAGEPLTPELTDAIYALGTVERVYDLYGPSEDTTYSTGALRARRGAQTIGRPIDNTRLYLLDGWLRPVATGAAGEICLAGRGLSRGYLSQPSLTAERFVPDPFGPPGARMYRTGDRGRHFVDGSVQLLGRMDYQVKLRGFRIELGEIETCLLESDGVTQAVVLMREDTIGDKRLVAYVAAAAGVEATVLRERLKTKLPAYMVPSAVVVLEKLPLTPNGKVDRKALPRPEARAASGYVPARTPTEETLARIWADLLGVDRVGIEDNFFDSGGDSILSIQVVSRLRQAGFDARIRDMLEAPTIAQFGALVARNRRPDAVQGPIAGPLPMSPIARSFLDSDPVDPHHFNQALLFEIEPSWSHETLRRCVQTLAEVHDALRLRFSKTASGWKSWIEPPSESVPLTQEHLADLPPAERTVRIGARCAELQGSLDLGQGPIFRVVHFDCGPREPGRLFWLIHHFAVDVVSWRILMDDLHVLMDPASATAGRLPDLREALPYKTTSIQVWNGRLIEYAKSTAVRAEVGYWRHLPWERVRPFPRDARPGVSEAIPIAFDTTVGFGEAETAALVRGQGGQDESHHSVNLVLLAAFALALQRQTGNDAVLIMCEGHGREDLFDDIDLSRTVGWFTSLFPVLVALPEGASPEQALDAVEEQVAQIPRKGIGFGLLRYLSHEQDTQFLAHLPKAHGLFNYLGQITGTADAGSEDTGPARSPRATPTHAVDASGAIVFGKLALRFSWDGRIVSRESANSFSTSFAAITRELVTQVLPRHAKERRAPTTPYRALDADETRARRVPRSLVTLQPRGTLVPLFCVHPQYGDILGFMDFAKQFAPDRPVFGFRSRGFEGQEPLTSIPAMAAAYIEELRAQRPTGPYVLVGWSMGGVIVFEMATQLRRLGVNVRTIVSLDQFAPTPDRTHGQRPLAVLDRYIAIVASALAEGRVITSVDVHEQCPHDLLFEIAHQLTWTAERALEESDLHALRVLRANTEAMDSYDVSSAPPDIPVLFVRASEASSTDSSCDWSRLSTNVETVEVPGDHLTMMMRPNVESIVVALTRALARLNVDGG